MKKIISIIVCCAFLFLLTACAADEVKEEGKFLTEIEWTNNGSDEGVNWIKIAVENEEYDGDVIKAGTYSIKHTNNRDVYGAETERVYNVFVSTESIDDPNNIDINWIETSIGGVNSVEDEITVKKGDYIYIQKVTGGSNGHIKLILK